MKRFLSMLAMAVLVLQSVATSLVYAADLADQNEESESVPVVETAAVDEDADDDASDEVVSDLVDVEDSVVDADLQEVESEDVEVQETEEIAVENNEESAVDEPVYYGKSFASMSSYQSWREISTNGLIVTVEDSL